MSDKLSIPCALFVLLMIAIAIVYPASNVSAQIEKEGQIGQYIGEIRGTSIDVYRFSNGGTVCYLTNGPNGRGAMSCIN